jgi:predicted esterase YcpF (UPF0227 family)
MDVLIFYIHGFNSGPKPSKAIEINEIVSANLITLSYDSSFECLYNINDLIYQVKDALGEKENLSPLLASESNVNFDPLLNQKNEDIIFMGTSLGGFYAKRLAEYFRTYCVMINPVIDPIMELRRFIGDHVNFVTGKQYRFTEKTLFSYQAYRKTSTYSPTLIFVSSCDELLSNNFEKVCFEFQNSAIIVKTNTSHQVRFKDLPSFDIRIRQLLRQ